MDDVSLGDLLESLPIKHIDFMQELLDSNHSEECIENLYSYDLSLVESVMSYYRIGYDIVPLILLGDSDWYLKFLLDCVLHRVDLKKLIGPDIKLSYAQVYNLLNAMCLGYDVDSLLSDPTPTLKDVLDECLNQEKGFGNNSNSVFLVEGENEEGELIANTIVAPSIRYSKILGCLEGGLDVFTCKSKLVDLNQCGIVSSNFY